jgi:hypothetical protein
LGVGVEVAAAVGPQVAVPAGTAAPRALDVAVADAGDAAAVVMDLGPFVAVLPLKVTLVSVGLLYK